MALLSCLRFVAYNRPEKEFWKLGLLPTVGTLFLFVVDRFFNFAILKLVNFVNVLSLLDFVLDLAEMKKFFRRLCH